MKDLKQHILEGLRINKSTRKNITSYAYRPKNKKELQKILAEMLNEDRDADLNIIDVSAVTDMSQLFLVHDPKKGYFEKLDPHDIDISDWDVSNVKDMNYMFYDCGNFTGKGLENWDVSNVEGMREMFYKCKKLNCDLRNWHINEWCEVSKMFNLIKNRQNIKIPKNLYDSKKKTHKSNGEELLWFKVWKILDKNGPMTKADVLTSMGLQPTSYATSFAKWSSCNMIVGDKGKLKAIPQSEWTKEIF